MKRWVLMAVAGAAIVVLSACGGAGVAVQAQIEGDTTVLPLRDLEVRALPYDRDAIFDSLAAAYPEPQPEIPDSLADLQQRYAQFQVAHNEAQDRWGTIRDSLQSINDRLAGLPKNSAQYRLLYLDWQALSGQEGDAKRRMDQAFEQLEQVRTGFTSQAADIRSRRELWADEAYASFADVVAAKLEALRREEVTDTTDANGYVQLSLPRGQWWIHARHDLPFEELYWNIAVQVEGGEIQQVVLNSETAEKRTKY